MHTALFIVGPPGVGKTTATRCLLTEGFKTFTDPTNGRVKWTFSGDLALVGHYGVGTFDGSDTIPNDGWQYNLDYWKANILPDAQYKATILEGDRFSHANAQAYLEAAGVRVLCAHLAASKEVLEGHRKARGSDQDPTWLQGRVTKARRFADRFLPPETGLFDLFGGGGDESTENRLTDIEVTDQPPEEIAKILRGLL